MNLEFKERKKSFNIVLVLYFSAISAWFCKCIMVEGYQDIDSRYVLPTYIGTCMQSYISNSSNDTLAQFTNYNKPCVCMHVHLGQVRKFCQLAVLKHLISPEIEPDFIIFSFLTAVACFKQQSPEYGAKVKTLQSAVFLQSSMHSLEVSMFGVLTISLPVQSMLWW